MKKELVLTEETKHKKKKVKALFKEVKKETKLGKVETMVLDCVEKLVLDVLKLI